MEVRTYKCDICEKEFEAKEDVAGSVTVDIPNGDMHSWADVCEKCATQIRDKVGELAGLTESN